MLRMDWYLVLCHAHYMHCITRILYPCTGTQPTSTEHSSLSNTLQDKRKELRTLPVLGSTRVLWLTEHTASWRNPRPYSFSIAITLVYFSTAPADRSSVSKDSEWFGPSGDRAGAQAERIESGAHQVL